MSAIAFSVTLTLTAVGLLVAADARGEQRAIWVWKPLASAGFLATALSAGALNGAYGVTLLAGLVLCALGDVLLIPDDERTLRAGMGAFLLGHVAFYAAFVVRGIDLRVMAAALALLIVPARGVVRWLVPRAAAEFRVPITAYATVISIMVAGAAATFARAPSWTILAGAVAFLLSDLSVARDRFVAPAFANRAWGWPLYYGAQLLLAASARFADRAPP